MIWVSQNFDLWSSSSTNQHWNLTQLPQLAKQWINFCNLSRSTNAMEKYLWFPQHLSSLLAVVSYCFFYFGLEISHNLILIQKILTLLDDVFWIWKPRTKTYTWMIQNKLKCYSHILLYVTQYFTSQQGPKASTSSYIRVGKEGREGRKIPISYCSSV